MRLRSLTSGKTVQILPVIVAASMIAYHLVYARLLVQSNLGHDNTHLAFALVLTFLVSLEKSRKRWLIFAALIALALASTGYVQYFMGDLMMRQGNNTTLDLVVGAILVLLVLEGTRQAFGMVLPALCAACILYAFFGHLLPGPLQTPDIGWQVVIARLSIGISGIYGGTLTISSTNIFLFMIFASLIMVTGATGFFNEVGNWISQRVRAGPALAAVVTSGLVGTVSGSVAANVMITGSFTIPAMKKVGYTPEQAGGIEAASSTAGPIIPPVMGATAFIIAGFVGIPYVTIAAAAAIPAVLYVISAAFYTYFQGERMQVTALKHKINVRELAFGAPLFLIPLLVITILFAMGFSPMFVGFWACITIMVLGFIRKKTRPSLSVLVEGLVRGAKLGANIGVICALVGILVLTVTMTGLAIRLPVAIEHMFGGNLVALLVFTGAICLLLGCGVTGIAAYLLTAIALAPALVNLGVGLLQAHLFVFFLSVFSFITPPVALAALFASRIAGGGYMRTAVEASLIGIAGFVLPFLIVFCPALTLDFSEPLIAVATLLTCPIVFLGLQSVIVGYFAKRLSIVERIIVFASPAALILFLYTKDFMLLLIGVGIIAGFTVWQMKQLGKQRRFAKQL